ncbi:MAG: ABC transporter permease [Propionibacteriaceae bacterium]|nr:ABC transporter permease [Propionibacteriaceae bacterium]
MIQLTDTFAWLVDPSNWSGSGGIVTRVLEHLWYCVLALVLAIIIAVPAGLYIGHTGKGRGIAIGLTGALRALPSLGLLTLLAVTMGLGLKLAIVPSTIVLAILAIPPLLAASYSGVEAVDGEVVDGARATGLSEWQIVRRVEIPLAGPLLVGGLRSAILQVIATATLSAYLGLGGLGRFIFDGQAVRDYTQMLGGAIVVIVLALTIDGLVLLAKKVLVPEGIGIALGTTVAKVTHPHSHPAEAHDSAVDPDEAALVVTAD